MGWGVNLMGYANVLETLQNLKVRFDGDTVYVVGTNVEYAVYQEFGTSKMKPQPYLRPAIREVMRNPTGSAEYYAKGGIDSEEDLIRGLALAIEELAKRFAPVDLGNLKGSIRAEKAR